MCGSVQSSISIIYCVLMLYTQFEPVLLHLTHDKIVVIGIEIYSFRFQTTKLHYVESGTENDRVILLLHGFPDCYFGWRYQIPVLSRHYRVIALDLKGFSDSDKPAMRHNYRPNTICSELKDFLEALHIKTVTIIGHDLGGLIGWIFTLKFPDFVSKFIAIASPHPNQYWQPSKTALTTRNWFYTVQVNKKLKTRNV